MKAWNACHRLRARRPDRAAVDLAMSNTLQTENIDYEDFRHHDVPYAQPVATVMLGCARAAWMPANRIESRYQFGGPWLTRARMRQII